jgi:hypothetical protein
MRVRKIHTVLAVSVALVLVARSLDGRRRAHDGFPAEPVDDFRSDGRVGAMTADPGASPEASSPEAEQVAPEEPVALQTELGSEEPSAPLEPEPQPEAESDAAPTRKRRLRRGPLAVAAATVVLIAVLTGTVLAVAAGASSPSGSHHGATSLLYP